MAHDIANEIRDYYSSSHYTNPNKAKAEAPRSINELDGQEVVHLILAWSRLQRDLLTSVSSHTRAVAHEVLTSLETQGRHISHLIREAQSRHQAGDKVINIFFDMVDAAINKVNPAHGNDHAASILKTGEAHVIADLLTCHYPVIKLVHAKADYSLGE